MTVKETYLTLAEKMNQNPEGINGENIVYQFDLSGKEEGTFQIKIADDKVECKEGTPFEPKCTLALSDQNFLKLLNGNLNPTMAYMSGKLKVNGQLGYALKLHSILQKYQ